MKKFVSLAVFTVIVLFACQRQVSNPEDGSGNSMTDSLAYESSTDAKAPTVCFESEVLPIFQTNCAKSGCHDAASHKEGYILDNYKHITAKGVVPYQPHESELYEVIAEGEMPPKGNPKLTTEQVTLIRRWIRQGAQNTRNCSTCDAAQFTYSGTISGIMETNCVGCHSAGNTSGGVDLSTYAGVNAVALDGRLAGTVTHAPGYVPMPMGAPQLSDCNIAQIQNWVAAGAPNN